MTKLTIKTISLSLFGLLALPSIVSAIVAKPGNYDMPINDSGVAIGLIIASISILVIFTTITVFESKLVQQRHVLRS